MKLSHVKIMSVFLQLFCCRWKKLVYFCSPFQPRNVNARSAETKKKKKHFFHRIKRKKTFIDIMKPNQVQEAQKAPVGWKFSLGETEGKRESILLNFLPGSWKHINLSKHFIQRRVWSWLRMNASGRPNTCKSRGKAHFGEYTTGARVRNAYATYL